jgi:hypothetical protein
MTQASGAQTFARKQAVGDEGPAQAVQILKKKARFFKSALLAGGIYAHQNLGSGQDGREAVHGRITDYAPATVQCNKLCNSRIPALRHAQKSRPMAACSRCDA